MPDPTLPRRILHATVRGLCIGSLAVVAACTDPEPAGERQLATDAPLPAPRAADGAITAMPASPGPGDVPLGGSPPAPPPPDGRPIPPPQEHEPDAGLAAVTAGLPQPAVPSTAPPDPRQVMRDYYAAINARDYASAHAIWSAAPGADQSVAEFAAGFADAASIEFTVGDPRPAQSTADPLVVEVPVTVTTTGVDGSVHHQAGRYTLRRLQTPASSPAPPWRIIAVDLRDAVRPEP